MKYEVMKTIYTAEGAPVDAMICTARDEHEAKILVEVLQDGHGNYNNGKADYWYREAAHGDDAGRKG